MKFFQKNLYLLDFVPPIFLKIIRLITELVFMPSSSFYDNKKNRKLFLHPIFNSHDDLEHEDILIDYLLAFKNKGFYVEVGANDPNNFPSHTTRFYLRGWHGINIEPQLKAFEGLCQSRQGDINIHCALSECDSYKYIYLIDGFSIGGSLNEEMALRSKKWQHRKDIKKEKIETKTLTNVFKNNLGNHGIDFMSVDVEGYELNILKGNDWSLYRPKLMIIETCHYDYDEIVNYLKTVNYTLIYNGITNSIFLENDYLLQVGKSDE